jgi:uncharacterized membrane protein YozB (DUF420 family)
MKLVNSILFFFISILSAGIFYVTLRYFEPNFESGFLKGKSDFYSQYIFRISLFTHGFTASISVVLLAILVFFRLEKKSISIHRLIGKISLISTIFLVFPSGIVLSLYADGGKVGKILFLFLSIFTCYAAISGWMAIRKKQVETHKTWMKYLLLLFCSAFFLRILIVIFFYAEIHSKSFYPVEVFLSWIPGSILFWIINFKKIQANA